MLAVCPTLRDVPVVSEAKLPKRAWIFQGAALSLLIGLPRYLVGGTTFHTGMTPRCRGLAHPVELELWYCVNCKPPPVVPIGFWIGIGIVGPIAA